MKVIAFGGSNSKNSINKKLATYAASLFKNATVEILDLNDFEMPLFGVDIEEKYGKQKLAQNFIDKMKSADVLVVSLAEHNGNYSVAFKNIFDWCSRITPQVFGETEMLLMATSPGARGGSSVLDIANNAFPRFATTIKATYTLPDFNDNFDVEKGEISNEELQKELQKLIADNF